MRGCDGKPLKGLRDTVPSARACDDRRSGQSAAGYSDDGPTCPVFARREIHASATLAKLVAAGGIRAQPSASRSGKRLAPVLDANELGERCHSGVRGPIDRLGRRPGARWRLTTASADA